MLALIQVRNRLVHHDGRVSAWHATQLDLGWLADESKLTARADPYQRRVPYGMEHTHVGMEFTFGTFALDTVLATIDELHATVYPEQTRAAWLRLPRRNDGGLDLDAATRKEPMLVLDR